MSKLKYLPHIPQIIDDPVNTVRYLYPWISAIEAGLHAVTKSSLHVRS